MIMLSLRWPWPLFKMLSGKLDQDCNARRGVAAQVLSHHDDTLERTTLKIKRMCASDLQRVKRTGCLMPGTKLHAILSAAALNITLDAGELESLNSMIKSAVSPGNSTHVSLELLSSRVNCRKTITMASSGDTRLANVQPIVSKLASTSSLYQGLEQHVMRDKHRWSPPEPISIAPGKPVVHDPSLKFSHSQRWAVKYNQQLMKWLHERHRAGVTGFLGMLVKLPTHNSVHVVSELAGRTCFVHNLEGHVVPHEGCDTDLWVLPQHLRFISLLDVVAMLFDDVKSMGKRGVDLYFVDLMRVTVQPSHKLPVFRLCFKIKGSQYAATMTARKPRTVKPKTAPPAPPAPLQANDQSSASSTAAGGSRLGAGSGVAVGHAAPHALQPGDNISEDEGDVDEDESVILALEQALTGEYDDELLEEFEQDMANDEQAKSNLDMDSIHARFAAAAVGRQQETGFCDVEPWMHQRAAEKQRDRPFEDSLAEELLDEFVQSRGDSVSPELKCQPRVRHGTPRQPPLLDDMSVQRCLSIWKSSVAESIESCAAMQSSLSRFDATQPDVCLGGDVSLVLRNSPHDAAEVSFVSWLKPHRRLEGRALTLDDNNGIIYPSHFRPKLTFHGAFMFIAQVGSRVRKKTRDIIADPVLRLQAMISTSIDSSSDNCGLNIDFTAGAVLSCIACGQQDDDTSKLQRCAFCLHRWHKACSSQACKCVPSFILTDNVRTLHQHDLSAGSLPFLLLSEPQRHRCDSRQLDNTREL